MIHKVAAATLMVHSRHTGTSTPATTGSNILLLAGVVEVGRLLPVVVIGTVLGKILVVIATVTYSNSSTSNIIILTNCALQIVVVTSFNYGSCSPT